MIYRFNNPTRPHPPLKPVKPEEYNVKLFDMADVLKLKPNQQLSLKRLVLMLGHHFVYDDILFILSDEQKFETFESFKNFRVCLRNFYKNENYMEQLDQYKKDLDKYEEEMVKYELSLEEYEIKAKEADLERIKALEEEIKIIKQRHGIIE